jgi:hypothetical protein
VMAPRPFVSHHGLNGRPQLGPVAARASTHDRDEEVCFCHGGLSYHGAAEPPPEKRGPGKLGRVGLPSDNVGWHRACLGWPRGGAGLRRSNECWGPKVRSHLATKPLRTNKEYRRTNVPARPCCTGGVRHPRPDSGGTHDAEHCSEITSANAAPSTGASGASRRAC